MSEISPFGTDLFGQPLNQPSRGPVAQRFTFPPFSILDAKSGDWNERKRAWVSMGIKSEAGRDQSLTYNIPLKSYDPENMETEYYGCEAQKTNTSVFDPVLCELVYRWFSPKGGQIVDPFAGGSVRGIVAAALERRYWGSDLRPEQIDSNREQAAEILGNYTTPVKISGKMLRQKFHACTPEFITGTCRGRCCEGTNGISVVVHESEVEQMESLGATVEDGYLKADERGLCPFKSDDGFCNIHESKPLGCKSSPFTFNESGTLIVRNRYRLLSCYNCEGAQPAYVAHRWSLEQIFGEATADKICTKAEAGEDEIIADMPAKSLSILVDNHNARNDGKLDLSWAKWVCGDSTETLEDSPESDLVFSCPPYGDLEKYSDDPKDLSAMNHDAFLDAYYEIIRKACDRLKNNRFACFVVGDFRGKDGIFRNFVSSTIEAFQNAGLEFYNHAILATSVGSASMRVTKQFTVGRKLCKVHQDVLVFVKGDWRKAAEACGQISSLTGESEADRESKLAEQGRRETERVREGSTKRTRVEVEHLDWTEPASVSETCPHGEPIGDCFECDAEADIAFDAAREFN